MCNTCEQAIKQEGAELSGTFRMIPVPSTPPPSPICLHRGRFLNCQDSGTGSVISFAEQAAFLPSVSGGSSPPGSPGRAGAKRSPPGEVERRSSSRSPAYFPGRNSTAGVQDYGVDRRGMPPLDFIAYLHQGLPRPPLLLHARRLQQGGPLPVAAVLLPRPPTAAPAKRGRSGSAAAGREPPCAASARRRRPAGPCCQGRPRPGPPPPPSPEPEQPTGRRRAPPGVRVRRPARARC